MRILSDIKKNYTGVFARLLVLNNIQFKIPFQMTTVGTRWLVGLDLKEKLGTS